MLIFVASRHQLIILDIWINLQTMTLYLLIIKVHIFLSQYIGPYLKNLHYFFLYNKKIDKF